MNRRPMPQQSEGETDNDLPHRPLPPRQSTDLAACLGGRWRSLPPGLDLKSDGCSGSSGTGSSDRSGSSGPPAGRICQGHRWP